LTHRHYGRMNAYSQDLREKIVQAVSERAMGKSEVARAFGVSLGVSLSSVKRYVGMAKAGRSLAPKRRPGSKPKLGERARRLLAKDVEENPFLTHSERREYLKAVAGVSVSNSTVCRELKRMERTRKKGA
jgi:transposase